MSSNKRPPDHYISLISKDSNGKKNFFEIGKVWDGKDGYKTGESAWGKIVIQSREKREELEKMRRENQLETTYEQEANASPEPSQEP